jgi:transposase-like protein
MGRGRRILGPGLIDGLEGSSMAKEKLRLIMETITGETGIAEACVELGIKEAMFHRMRREMLAGAVGLLEPAPTGRPPHVETEDEKKIKKLQAEIQELKLTVQGLRVKEQIALAMPHLLVENMGKDEKKTRRSQ